MQRRLVSGLVLFIAACSGATEGGSSVQEQKAEAAAARARGTLSGDPCADKGWYGDGTCDTFCPDADADCIPTGDDDPIVCAAFIEVSDGRCGRPDNDPCRSQDPDCGNSVEPGDPGGSAGGPNGSGGSGGVICTAISEVPDGECRRPETDPCRFQDPDCARPTPAPLYDCDPRHITCQTLVAVECPDGQLPRVVEGCYGACVPRDQCEPIACLAYIELPDGVCSRPSNDPCKGQDPDCVTP